MKLNFLLIPILALLLDCQNSSKGTDNTLLGALLLASRPPSTSTTTPPTTPPTGGGTTTQTLTVSNVSRSSTTPIISGDSVTFTINVSSSSNPKDYTLNLYFSTDSTVDTNDTLMGTITVNNSTASTQTLTVTIPNTLVPETEGLPKYFFYKFLGENASTPSATKLTIFPYKSKVESSSMGAVNLTTYNMNADTEKFFIGYSITSITTKLTFSAFAIQDTLDVDLLLVQENSSSYSGIGSTEDANGPGNYEFASYTASGGGFLMNSVYLRIGKVSGTGTFKAAGMSNGIVPPFYLKPSCNGGTGGFANRCVDYLDGDPGNNTGCVALQGTGSTYSSLSCTSTSRIARCFANPLLNDKRAVISFYTPADTTSSAATACGSDILLTP